jgi:hypothetical protein
VKLLEGRLLLGLYFYTDLEFSFDPFLPNVRAIYFDSIDYCAAICYPRFLSKYFTFVIRSSFPRDLSANAQFCNLYSCKVFYSIQMHVPA